VRLMLGLAGTHNTGKTTLAKEFAQKRDIPVVLTSASQVYHSLGMDPAADYSIEQRIGAQKTILHAFTRQYAHAAQKTPLFIADRTPLDLISYMLADIQRATVLDAPRLGELITGYVDECYEVLNRFFSTVLVVQPGIPLQPNREGKAGACPAFMEHQNMILRGSLNDDRCQVRGFLIPKGVTDLQQRVKCIDNAYINAFQRQTEAVANLRAEGAMLH